jgi:hypothetical protein
MPTKTGIMPCYIDNKYYFCGKFPENEETIILSIVIACLFFLFVIHLPVSSHPVGVPARIRLSGAQKECRLFRILPAEDFILYVLYVRGGEQGTYPGGKTVDFCIEPPKHL